MYRFFDSFQNTYSLWTGSQAICKCAHHLILHSRNDEPQKGHCLIGGCRCDYFSSNKVRIPRRKNDVILEITRRLDEAEFEQSKISQEIIHRLDGFVDASYVNKGRTDFPQRSSYRNERL